MTGNLSDPATLPKVVPRHCLRTRFNGSSCALCRDACPHNLPTLDGDVSVSIDTSLCSACHLCAAACPAGAIEPRLTAETVTAALNRPLPIVLSCHRAPEECNLRIPCFGFLAEEYLLAMYALSTTKICLNIIHCAECSNHYVVNYLLKRVSTLEAKTGLPISNKIRLIERAADLHFQEEAVDRRGFFKSLTSSLLREAAAVLTQPVTESDKPAPYAQKHLPLQLIILNLGLDLISGGKQPRIAALFRVKILRSDACDGCRACTKVCPTGALIENVSNAAAPFEFEASKCTKCGLCVEFCLHGALGLHCTDPSI